MKNNTTPQLKTILMINTLDNRYGSTYRSRHLYIIFRDAGYNVFYSEPNNTEIKPPLQVFQGNSLVSWLWTSVKRAWLAYISIYDILYLMKVTPLHIPVILVAKLRHKTIWVDWDDLDSEFQSNSFRKSFFRLMEGIIPRFCTLVTTHSRYISNHIQGKFPGKKIYYIPQTVDTNTYSPSKRDNDDMRKKLGISDNKVLGYLCTLTEGGMRDLGKVLGITTGVIKNRDDIFLLIIGGGPLQKKAELMVRGTGIKRYFITGMVSHDDIPVYLSIIDIALIYMREDIGNSMRFSLKLLEYLAMDLVVVGHVVGESADLFRGYYREEGQDINQSVKRILELLETSGNKLSGASNFINKNYSLQNITQMVRKNFHKYINEGTK